MHRVNRVARKWWRQEHILHFGLISEDGQVACGEAEQEDCIGANLIAGIWQAYRETSHCRPGHETSQLNVFILNKNRFYIHTSAGIICWDGHVVQQRL